MQYLIVVYLHESYSVAYTSLSDVSATPIR